MSKLKLAGFLITLTLNVLALVALLQPVPRVTVHNIGQMPEDAGGGEVMAWTDYPGYGWVGDEAEIRLVVSAPEYDARAVALIAAARLEGVSDQPYNVEFRQPLVPGGKASFRWMVPVDTQRRQQFTLWVSLIAARGAQEGDAQVIFARPVDFLAFLLFGLQARWVRVALFSTTLVLVIIGVREVYRLRSRKHNT